MQRINLTLPGEKSAQHLWGRAGAQGRGGGAGGSPALPAALPGGLRQGRLAANTSLLLPSSSPRARAMIPLLPPPLPPGRRCRRRESPHGDRHPVPAPAAEPGPSAAPPGCGTWTCHQQDGQWFRRPRPE